MFRWMRPLLGLAREPAVQRLVNELIETIDRSPDPYATASVAARMASMDRERRIRETDDILNRKGKL